MTKPDNNHTNPEVMGRRQWFRRVAGAIAGVGAAGALAKATAENPTEGISIPASPQESGKRRVSRIAAGEAVACTSCDRCMPCGYGIDIPGNFEFYNAMLAADAIPDMSASADRSDPRWRSKAKNFLRKYDSTIRDPHQSQRCIKCFHCVNECTDRVFIVNELAALTAITDELRDWECREL